MAIILYIVGGSPYAWRVRLALEHKRIAHQVHMLSFEAGELKQPQFTALNPRKKVPTLVLVGEPVRAEKYALSSAQFCPLRGPE